MRKARRGYSYSTCDGFSGPKGLILETAGPHQWKCSSPQHSHKQACLKHEKPRGQDGNECACGTHSAKAHPSLLVHKLNSTKENSMDKLCRPPTNLTEVQVFTNSKGPLGNHAALLIVVHEAVCLAQRLQPTA